ncbi:MAG: radical SAM protein [Candidatus Omnitrophota bacterium]|nr:MAG: radical SAM protein [Candidatus Omnitrophota bacterium]
MSLITPFDPWKGKLCTCPQKHSLSAYAGCGHGCLYCYASSYIIKFFSPRPKKDFLDLLKKEIPKVPKGSIITISNSSDPYLPLEKKYKLTQGMLEILKDYDLKLLFVTRSVLILRDIDRIKECRNVVVSFTLTTLKKELAKKLEPAASSPHQRLKAMQALSKHVPVVCRFDPLIYPLNTEEITEVVGAIKEAGAKQVITSTYKVKPDNFKRMTKAFSEYKELWEDLYLKQGEKLGQYIYLPKNLRKELIEKVKQAALNKGLDFSSCREGLQELNTKNCDGSSFF